MGYAFSKIGIRFRVFSTVIIFISSMTSIGHFIDIYGVERGIVRSAVLAIGGFCLTDGAIAGWGALIASCRTGTLGHKIGRTGTIAGVVGSGLTSVHYIVALAGFDFLGLGDAIQLYSTIGVASLCITQVILINWAFYWIYETGGGYLIDPDENAKLREKAVSEKYPAEYYEPISIPYTDAPVDIKGKEQLKYHDKTEDLVIKKK